MTAAESKAAFAEARERLGADFLRSEERKQLLAVMPLTELKRRKLAYTPVGSAD